MRQQKRHGKKKDRRQATNVSRTPAKETDKKAKCGIEDNAKQGQHGPCWTERKGNGNSRKKQQSKPKYKEHTIWRWEGDLTNMAFEEENEQKNQGREKQEITGRRICAAIKAQNYKQKEKEKEP